MDSSITYNSKIIEKENVKDKKVSIAIMSSFAILTIQYLILIYFNLIGTDTGHIIQLTSKGLVGLFYLLALPIVLKRNKIKFIGIYFVALFIFILNYVLFNENWIYLKTIIFPLFFTGLPSFIYAYSIRDWDVLTEVMEKTAGITFVVGTLIGILVFAGYASVGTYSMSLSYYMLLPAIIYMNEFMEKTSFKSGVALLISFLVILSLGSRGAIMCIGVFIILKSLRFQGSITYIRVVTYLIIFSIIVIGFIFLNEILGYIYNFLLGHGIQSRNLRLFLEGGVRLSGRDSIYNSVFREILNNPFLGIGLAGDRLIVGGSYAHNIFIEILADFGVIIGSFIIVALLYIIIKSLIFKDVKTYNMVIIWLSIGFVSLFVSGSYLTDFKFWIMLGLLLGKLQKNNKMNSSKRRANYG